jgi:hypothetical protein
MEKTDLNIHPEAAKRFDERTQEILLGVQALQHVRDPNAQTPDVHPVDAIRQDDVVSRSRFIFGYNPLGDPTGVTWVSGTMHVGWVGAAFEPIKALVESIAATKPFPSLVSFDFLLQQTCEWLCDTLERRCSDPLSEFIRHRSDEAIRDHEIWIPLFETYSSKEFSIGDVVFKTFTREIMDEWWDRRPPAVRDDPRVSTALNKRRSELQAHLAACVRVHAEEHKAIEIARAEAENATALLRFLSPANLNSGLTSFCTPTSTGTVPQITTVLMEGGKINRISRGVADRRQTDWLLDDTIQLRPGVLENLHRLASDTSTEFCRSLYDALILYSRQTLAFEVSDKLVFTLSALESMLLRDSNEPIQKNLGERMAFLIGQSPAERKDIVKNIDATYRIRSAFVHHAQTARHIETVDRFLINAWTTFSRLMDLSVKYKTKAALIGALEDLKMS